ncbi:PhnB protein [Quadrisphaera granulorum]|uniref:PhnB protein n=1 Tax=Quadrisphaera granulorum TaxID=317664 RepID=A0A316AMB9_9ACTN|nr:VOC family protein [Quadrisphaera granulorum]PWJ51157.1 PhnB protein [Quadrisphaera granulorum]SZE97807.1 PhnB protein [Quadrisphaera granulorum]
MSSENALAPVPYLLLPGIARAALVRYQEVFGGELQFHSYADFGRSDGPPDLIAHGQLRGSVSLFAADAHGSEEPFRCSGLLLSLLGAAAPEELHRWFDALSEGGTVLDPLQQRPWGASDGQVRDAHGVTWLIGYEPDDAA